MLNVVKPLITSRSILILIDMQTGFATAKDESTIHACKMLLEEFKRQQLSILFLRYGLEVLSPTEKYSHGRILPALTQTVKNYPFVKILTKHVDSGAIHVEKYLVCKDFRLFLGGVNTSSCVLSTAKGLKARGYNDIYVVPEACNDDMSWNYVEHEFKQVGVNVIG